MGLIDDETERRLIDALNQASHALTRLTRDSLLLSSEVMINGHLLHALLAHIASHAPDSYAEIGQRAFHQARICGNVLASQRIALLFSLSTGDHSHAWH